MKLIQRMSVLWVVLMCVNYLLATPARLVAQTTEWPANKQVVWSPDGKYIANLERNGAISIWDVETGEAMRQINEEVSQKYRDSGLTHIVNAMSWNTENDLAVAADGGVQIWDASEGTVITALGFPEAPKPERTRIGGEAGVSDVIWTSDGSTLVTSSGLGNLLLWNARNYQFIRAVSPGSGFALDMRDNSLVVATTIGVALFSSYREPEYHLLSAQEDAIFEGDEIVVVVKWSFDGAHLLAITFDGRTYIWNFATKSNEPVHLIRNLPYLSLTRHTMFLDAEDWTVIESDGSIRRYSISTGDTIQAYALEHMPTAAAWSPYAARVAYFTTNNPSVLQIEVPFPSTEELTRVLERCRLDEHLTVHLNAYVASRDLSTFIKEVENASEREMPIACQGDLLAIAQAINA